MCGQISINVSNVDGCEEKEIVIPFSIDATASNHFISNMLSFQLWESIHQKLRFHLNTSDDNEWFDKYSIYTKDPTCTFQVETQLQPMSQQSSKLMLVKSMNDFNEHLQRCCMTKESGHIVLFLEIRVE